MECGNRVVQENPRGSPELHRVRLELARILYMAREDAAARYHFELVRAADIPEQVANNIERFLYAIRRRRAWSVNFAFGLSPDTNINGGSRNDTITVAGLPFQLSSDAQQTSGVGVLTSLNLERYLPLHGDWLLKVEGDVLRRDFRKSQYDDMTMKFSAGAVLAARGESSASGHRRRYVVSAMRR